MSLPYLWGTKCAAKGCNSNPRERRFFRFPNTKTASSKIRRQKWIECAKTDNFSATNLFLCELHFDGRQFRDAERTLLIYGAVPTIPSLDSQQKTCVTSCTECQTADASVGLHVCVDSELCSEDGVNRTPYKDSCVKAFPNCSVEHDDVSVHPAKYSFTSRVVSEGEQCEENLQTCEVWCDHPYAKQTSIISAQTECDVSNTKGNHDIRPTNCVNSISPVLLMNDLPVASSTPKLKPVRLFASKCNEKCEGSDTKFGESPSCNVTSKTFKERNKYLNILGCNSYKEITPRKKKLIKLVAKKQRSLLNIKNKFQKQNLTLKELLNKDCDAVRMVEWLSKSMSLASANFLASQMRCGKKKPKGRRWTLTDKVMALSVYKKSPKCYTLLSTMFALPSKKTLVVMVRKIIMVPGINEHIFVSLEKTVSKMDEIDRTCVVMFDEMSLYEHMEYDIRADTIVGFEDLGHLGKSAKIANHALVFLVKGLHKKWKQPVAFYFTTGNLASDNLVKLLLSILEACQKVGLNVVATVCDMGPNNTRTLKLLGVTEEKPYFYFGKNMIITLYDSPHLLKCIRNMIFKHNVIVKLKIGDKVIECAASWAVIRAAYNIDRSQVTYRMLHKLTDCHLDPKGRTAMKVALAAQVLSHSTAAAIDSLVASGKLDASALGTAHFVAFCNKLFDSVNGAAARPEGAGGLRCQLRKTREKSHLMFWEESIDLIKQWKVEKCMATQENTSTSMCAKYFSPPCLSGWVITLRGMNLLWGRLKELGFTYLQPRSVNQDPIEHVFGCIRANCGSNVNPTVPQFVSALKASMINGLAMVDVRSNCEAELEPCELLSNLREFVTCSPGIPSKQGNSSQETSTTTSCTVELENTDYSVAYVAGSIAKRILMKSQCKNCKQVLVTSMANDYLHSCIIFKEYSSHNQSLTYPSEELIVCVGSAATVLETTIPEIAHGSAVLSKLLSVMKTHVDFEWLKVGCPLHVETLKDNILSSVCYISIPWWCTKRNRDLSNSIKKRLESRKIKILKHK